MPLEAFYFAAGTLAVLTFLVFLTFNIWKTYRHLDWRQAAVFSAALFFAAGVVFQTKVLSYTEAAPTYSSMVQRSNHGRHFFHKQMILITSANNKKQVVSIPINFTDNGFTGLGRDEGGSFLISGFQDDSKRIFFKKAYDSLSIKNGAVATPFEFRGFMTAGKNGPQWQGYYSREIKVGKKDSVKNPLRTISVSDRWKALISDKSVVKSAAKNPNQN